MEKIIGVEVNLLRLFLDEKMINICTVASIMFAYFFYYLQTIPSCTLPFTVFCVLFNIAKSMESQQK